MWINIFYFFVAMMFLIVAHEYGHFQVARWCGVHVVRFSFGFGPVLVSYQDKKGTDFVWSLFPLGGYVKMLEDSLNHQSIVKRLMIVLAGPVCNFMLAIFLLWCTYVWGMQSTLALIDAVKPGGIAQQAGIKGHETIVSVNGHSVKSWRDVQWALMPVLGTKKAIKIDIQSLDSGLIKTVWLKTGHFLIDPKQGFLNVLGIVPYVPKVSMVVAKVGEGTPAAKAGFLAGDRVLSMDKHSFSEWHEMANYVQMHPNQWMDVTVFRDNQERLLRVYVLGQKHRDTLAGFVGLQSKTMSWPSAALIWQKDTLGSGLVHALSQTGLLITTTIKLLGRMVTGSLSWDGLSGPVGIAMAAGDSARGGVAAYLSFLALLSVGLGVMNLLPIPILDGGHALYLLIEGIRRRPLSEKAKIRGFQLGIVFLMMLMTLALKNDWSQL